MLQQISVIAENKKGALEDIIGNIANAGIDFYNVVSNDSPEFGIVRLLCSDPEKAMAILKEQGYMCKINPVVGAVIPEQVGALHSLLQDVKAVRINIDYMYVCYVRSSENPVAILHVDEYDALEECLKSKGYTLL